MGDPALTTNPMGRGEKHDGCEVPQRVVGQLLLEARIGRVAVEHHEVVVAVGWCFRGHCRSDHTVAALRLSTTTCWPSAAVRRSATIRAT